MRRDEWKLPRRSNLRRWESRISQRVRLHSEDDSEHLREGYEMLARRADWDLDEVLAVIEQGWSIVETVSDRTVELMTAHLETVEAVLR